MEISRKIVQNPRFSRKQVRGICLLTRFARGAPLPRLWNAPLQSAFQSNIGVPCRISHHSSPMSNVNAIEGVMHRPADACIHCQKVHLLGRCSKLQWMKRMKRWNMVIFQVAEPQRWGVFSGSSLACMLGSLPGDRSRENLEITSQILVSLGDLT